MLLWVVHYQARYYKVTTILSDVYQSFFFIYTFLYYHKLGYFQSCKSLGLIHIIFQYVSNKFFTASFLVAGIVLCELCGWTA